MERVDEFMQRFYRAEDDLRMGWLDHAKPFQERWFAKEHRAHVDRSLKFGSREIEHISTSGELAEVIVSECSYEGFKSGRYRYRLQPSGESWLILSKDWECFACRGTGSRGGNVCGH